MKVKVVKIEKGTKLVYKGKTVKIGDVLDLPKDRAEYYVAKGLMEVVKEKSKKQNDGSENK